MQHDTARLREIKADPDFQKLVRSRTRFSLVLTALTLVIYLGFVLLVAFAPGWLGQSLSGGVTTIGIPLGVGIIAAAFVLTGVYIARANTTYDALTQKLIERHK